MDSDNTKVQEVSCVLCLNLNHNVDNAVESNILILLFHDRWLVSVMGGCPVSVVCWSVEGVGTGQRDGPVNCTAFLHQQIAYSDSYTRGPNKVHDLVLSFVFTTRIKFVCVKFCALLLFQRGRCSMRVRVWNCLSCLWMT